MNCENCNTSISGLSDCCSHCGFPYNGSEKEKQVFRGRQRFQKGQLEESQKQLKRASVLLYLVAAVMFKNGVVVFLNEEDTTSDLIIYGFAAICLLCFGFYLKYNPVLLISTALCLITSIYFLQAWSNGVEVLLNGVLTKGVIYVLLITAMVSAIEAGKIKKENKTLA